MNLSITNISDVCQCRPAAEELVAFHVSGAPSSGLQCVDMVEREQHGLLWRRGD